METRFLENCRLAAWLTNLGHVVYAPIAAWHSVAKFHALPTDAQFWKESNRVFLTGSARVIIDCQSGWMNSIGVSMEIVLAVSNSIPIWFATKMDDNEYDIRKSYEDL